MSIDSIATPRASRLAVAVATAFLSQAAFAAELADPRTLDRVEVRSARPSPLEAERALTPGGVTVLDGDTFAERGVTQLADALRYVPGVWAESSGGGDAIFISSRGSNLDATAYDGNGIKLFQDGLPVTTADGNNHNRFVDPLSARHVVVARGANALTYGASTLGGAIDFVSPTARTTPARQVHLQSGRHGAWLARLTAGGVRGDADALVTLEGLGRDGYRAHSRQDRAGLYANAGWRASDTLALRAFATYIDNEEELPGALTRAQFEADPTQANPSAITGNLQLNVRSQRLALRGDWTPPSGRLEFGLSYEDQHLYHPIVDRILVDFDGPGPNAPVEVFSLLKTTDQRTLGGMLRYGLRLGRHDVLAGLNLARTRERGGNYRNLRGLRNGQTGLIDNRADSMEAFVVDRWAFAPGWTLVIGAQGVSTGRDVRSTSLPSGVVRNPEGDYASINPRLGLIRALGERGEAFASVARLYEAPTTFELEDDARGDGSTLDAMHGTVVEAGLRGRTSRWHWDASVYYARIGDAILSVDDPARPGTSLSANIDRTVHAGLEALVGASLPLGGVQVEPLISATYNAFSFDDDPRYANNDLPAAPKYAVRGEVMLRGAGGGFIGPTFDLVGARYADFANSYRVASYRLLGLRAGIERGRWSLFAEVRNLLDTAFVGSFNVRNRAGAGDAILQPGAPRSVHVGMRMTF